MYDCILPPLHYHRPIYISAIVLYKASKLLIIETFRQPTRVKERKEEKAKQPDKEENLVQRRRRRRLKMQQTFSQTEEKEFVSVIQT